MAKGNAIIPADQPPIFLVRIESQVEVLGRSSKNQKYFAMQKVK